MKTFKKDPKPKSKDFEYTFEDSTTNYVCFLKQLLERVGLGYRASETRLFQITVQVPPAGYVFYFCLFCISK
jgi:hypothetical protein